MENWVESLRPHGETLCFAGGPHEEQATYREISERIERHLAVFHEAGLTANSIIAFPGQYTLDAVACFLATADLGGVAVPLPDDGEERVSRLLTIARATHRVVLGPNRNSSIYRLEASQDPTIPSVYQALQRDRHAGLVLFTSGSTGDPKAAVQDLSRLRLRYTQARTVGKMLAFMHLDHIGGVNTMLYTLSHGGSLVVPKTRAPHDVASAIQEHRIEVLPVSPTFLNLLLLSGAAEVFDLSSLRRITYGSEAMPQSVLDRVAEKMPHVEMLQTYGTTELGILKSKSENNGSLWMKVGGDGYETKVVDGRLWVRAQTAMVGYLNAPSPFDDDGFMDTGDQVEVRGEWMRILGRKSEIINVGGIKISPVDVESVLLEMPEVAEVSVVGRPHPMVGQVVEATVRLEKDMPLAEFKIRMREHCRGRLPPEAVPAKVICATGSLVTDRFKRDRRLNSGQV